MISQQERFIIFVAIKDEGAIHIISLAFIKAVQSRFAVEPAVYIYIAIHAILKECQDTAISHSLNRVVFGISKTIIDIIIDAHLAIFRDKDVAVGATVVNLVHLAWNNHPAIKIDKPPFIRVRLLPNKLQLYSCLRQIYE